MSEIEDTQPMLKQILEEMRSGFDRVDKKFDRFEPETRIRFDLIEKEMRDGFERVENRFASFEYKFDVVMADLVEVRRSQRKLHERVEHLGRKPG